MYPSIVLTSMKIAIISNIPLIRFMLLSNTNYDIDLMFIIIQIYVRIRIIVMILQLIILQNIQTG